MMAQSRRVLVISVPEMDDLATEIIESAMAQQEQQQQQQRGGHSGGAINNGGGGGAPPRLEFTKEKVKWATFPDGTPNIMIEGVEEIRCKDVLFIANFRNLAESLGQFAIIYAIPRYFARSFTVLVPFFPTGTMERVDEEGQVATAMTLARMMSAAPLTQDGPVRYVHFDIHALQTRFYFSDTVVPCLLSAVPVLREVIRQELGGENLVIAFPDDGAKKRFGKSFPDQGEDQIVLSKERIGDVRKLRLAEGDPNGKHVLIVDDLVQSGSTLLQAIKLVRESGAEKVSCFVTHGIFPNDSWKKFEDAGLEKFYLTNTLPYPEGLKNASFFRILSIAPEMAKFLLCSL